MNVPIYNLRGEEAGTAEVSDALFDVPWNAALVKRASTVQLSNRRVQRSYPRGRSEVSGGGRKPWRQKGTGRARHGSIRSPLWKGGGVAFGSALRNFLRKVNKKERRLALHTVFARRYRDGGLKVIDSFDANIPAKEARANVEHLLRGKRGLFLTANDNVAFYRTVRNVSGADVVRAGSLSLSDLMNHATVFVERAALEHIA